MFEVLFSLFLFFVVSHKDTPWGLDAQTQVMAMNLISKRSPSKEILNIFLNVQTP